MPACPIVESNKPAIKLTSLTTSPVVMITQTQKTRELLAVRKSAARDRSSFDVNAHRAQSSEPDNDVVVKPSGLLCMY